MDGYRITRATRRALTEFREELPPAGALLKLCPPGECRCAEEDVIVDEPEA